jgi:hypothetical protein
MSRFIIINRMHKFVSNFVANIPTEDVKTLILKYG